MVIVTVAVGVDIPVGTNPGGPARYARTPHETITDNMTPTVMIWPSVALLSILKNKSMKPQMTSITIEAYINAQWTKVPTNAIVRSRNMNPARVFAHARL